MLETIPILLVEDDNIDAKTVKRALQEIHILNPLVTVQNGIEALEYLNDSTQKRPGIILLDINMPKISGLTFYKSLQNPPHVIFTTAYSQYAIEGFEVNAIDYLLKPFSFDRFFKAVNKVIENQSGQEVKNHEDSFILIKSSKTLHKVNPSDILFIEALGDYVKVHLETSYLLTNNTFTSVLESLPELVFIRTHKSFAINFAKMNSLEGNLITINDHKIPIGQKYKADFLSIINAGKKI